jgi:hypothetical protein
VVAQVFQEHILYSLLKAQALHLFVFVETERLVMVV